MSERGEKAVKLFKARAIARGGCGRLACIGAGAPGYVGTCGLHGYCDECREKRKKDPNAKTAGSAPAPAFGRAKTIRPAAEVIGALLTKDTATEALIRSMRSALRQAKAFLLDLEQDRRLHFSGGVGCPRFEDTKRRNPSYCEACRLLVVVDKALARSAAKNRPKYGPLKD